ncbi:SulP family inorganic anion transporter [Dyadobacter sp. 3J3]|uniref:SulP family inorganic anion transporter n=1 Tax=Dyadobacter sp. 3J3 TaxID=2606600 RepID=UPI001356BD01|nr:SulP family inorganic anion transporter [Dyadobacter sp. 3J3]
MKPFSHLINSDEPLKLKTEILSGLTVAFALVPEAMAFAMIAGLSPLNGLYASISIGFVTSLLGGRPGMISGSTGAVAVVIISLSKSYGIEYVFAAGILAGIIQLVAAIFHFEKLLRLIPLPVVSGFVNGLAIIIFFSQLDQFKIEKANGLSEWLSGPPLLIMISLVLLTIFIIWMLPKLTNIIPSSLIAILFIFSVVTVLKIPTKTIGDISLINGKFPPFHIPQLPISKEVIYVVFPYAMIIASVGLIETLLTFNILNETIKGPSNSNKEIRAQGIANIVSGLFSGMSGCAMLGQSMVNVSSGARTRLSGIFASLSLLLLVMFGSGIIIKIPMAALTGIMIVVAVKTFSWSSLKTAASIPFTDLFTMVSVTAITVFFNNLALAVLIGVIISSLIFAWQGATMLRITNTKKDLLSIQYKVSGPLFFGSVSHFTKHFQITDDQEFVTIDLSDCKIFDITGLISLHNLTDQYRLKKKKLYLLNLNDHNIKLLKRSNSFIKVNLIEHKNLTCPD